MDTWYTVKLTKLYPDTAIVLPGFLVGSKGAFTRRAYDAGRTERTDYIRLRRSEAFAVAAVVASLGYTARVIKLTHGDAQSRLGLYEPTESARLFALAAEVTK